jgi:N-acetylated-alpha-linked acidic dipeptidase
VHYNIGPSPDSLEINLVNKQDYFTTPIWNAIGVINGTLEDEVVVIGNHRDAWILGGAGDPNSGSAILNECVRAFGKALEAGWKPQRTIVFASWDGEEYGLLGSTEWVEEYLPWLSSSAVAYINLDVGASGPNFMAGATPVLDQTIVDIVKEVQSPNQTAPGQTIFDQWDKSVQLLGSGSDFTAFLDFAGVSCVHVGFEAGPGTPVYQYHSNYDSFHWMDKFGDPGFKYHVALAQVTALLAAKLVEEPIIQFNAYDYALAIKFYLIAIREKLYAPILDDKREAFLGEFESLWSAHRLFHVAAGRLDFDAVHLDEQLQDIRVPETIPDLFQQTRDINYKYKMLERQFLHPDGLEGRSWFKHQIYAPGVWTGYAAVALPGLAESLDKDDIKAFRNAAKVLKERFAAAAEHLSAQRVRPRERL